MSARKDIKDFAYVNHLLHIKPTRYTWVEGSGIRTKCNSFTQVDANSAIIGQTGVDTIREPLFPHHHVVYYMGEWMRAFRDLAAAQAWGLSLAFHLDNDYHHPQSAKVAADIATASWRAEMNSYQRYNLPTDPV